MESFGPRRTHHNAPYYADWKLLTTHRCLPLDCLPHVLSGFRYSPPRFLYLIELQALLMA